MVNPRHIARNAKEEKDYIDIGPTSPSTDPITPGVGQADRKRTSFYVDDMVGPWFESRIPILAADA